MVANYPPISADGRAVEWETWEGEHREALTVRWDNEAWTATGSVGRERVEYVLRVDPMWKLRQFMLFRDMDQPDLWLATDGRTRWGEMNGAHRPDLDGCVDIDLACTPFGHTLPIRRLPLDVAEAAELLVASIDVDTLGVVPTRVRYTRLGSHSWRLERRSGDRVQATDFDVDEHGLALDWPGEFRRVR